VSVTASPTVTAVALVVRVTDGGNCGCGAGGAVVNSTCTVTVGDVPHARKYVYVPTPDSRTSSVPLAALAPDHPSPPEPPAALHVDPSLELHVSVTLCPADTLVALACSVGGAVSRKLGVTMPDAKSGATPQNTK